MVQLTRADFKHTASSRLCSSHFVDEDFTEQIMISRRLGLQFKAQLKQGVIPSAFPKQTPTTTKVRRVDINAEANYAETGHVLEKKNKTSCNWKCL